MKFLVALFLLFSCSSMSTNTQRTISSSISSSISQVKDDVILKYIKMPGMVKEEDREVTEILFAKSGRVFTRTTPWKSYKDNKRALKKLVMKLNPVILKSINSKVSSLNPEALLKLEMEKYDAYPCDAGGRSLKLLFLDKEVSIREDKDCNGRYKLKSNTKAFNEVYNLNQLGAFVLSLLEFTQLN